MTARMFSFSLASTESLNGTRKDSVFVIILITYNCIPTTPLDCTSYVASVDRRSGLTSYYLPLLAIVLIHNQLLALHNTR